MLSIIIPTLQKEVNILNKLISELVCDECIDEVIVVDNSLKGYDHSSKKVKVIIPETNLFVNPAWNLGIKNAKNEYFGILNDDLLLPKNMCKQVYEFLIANTDVGLIGLSNNVKGLTKLNDFETYPKDSKIKIKPMKNLLKDQADYWGSAFFGHKNSYYPIPDDIKIWCGDNYLLKMNYDNNKMCFKVTNCQIKHFGSLSCKSSTVSEILRNDVKLYSKIDVDYEEKCELKNAPNIAQRLFSIRNEKNIKYLYFMFTKIKLKEKFLN